MATQLKADAIMDQMKLHMSTDVGKQLFKKVGLVYQINVAQKVLFFASSLFFCAQLDFLADISASICRKLGSVRSLSLLI